MSELKLIKEEEIETLFSNFKEIQGYILNWIDDELGEDVGDTFYHFIADIIEVPRVKDNFEEILIICKYYLKYIEEISNQPWREDYHPDTAERISIEIYKKINIIDGLINEIKL